jgi:hypothetical protein
MQAGLRNLVTSPLAANVVKAAVRDGNVAGFQTMPRNFGWLLKARQRNLQSTGIKIAS